MQTAKYKPTMVCVATVVLYHDCGGLRYPDRVAAVRSIGPACCGRARLTDASEGVCEHHVAAMYRG